MERGLDCHQKEQKKRPIEVTTDTEGEERKKILTEWEGAGMEWGWKGRRREGERWVQATCLERLGTISSLLITHRAQIRVQCAQRSEAKGLGRGEKKRATCENRE